MNSNNISPDIKAISILHAAMVLGVLVFAGISIFLINLNGPFATDIGELNKYLPIIIGILAFGGLVSSHLIYRKRINQAVASSLPLSEKVMAYRSALLLYLALSEGAALFCVIAFMLTGNYWIIGIAGLLVINMIIKRPSSGKFIDEMQLSSQEQMNLKNN
jgi:hypothetical protein